MRRLIAALSFVFVSGEAAAVTSETVYVETPLDTDHDGKADRLYVEVSRPTGGTGLPTVYTVSPYAMGGNDAPNHDVDMTRLPQDAAHGASLGGLADDKRRVSDREALRTIRAGALARGYASVSAHSLGTGYSTGCPTVGDESEAIAARAVIDWLNGKARAFDANGREAFATWASGNVGMTGVSYNGTLPNMVATTGVEGLKAIVPVAAISSWYDYYRANGLVVGPGGYVGEDADVLGQFIVRASGCAGAVREITRTMGRDTGDFTAFWQDRDYVARAAGVRAAVFIMHGQSDWNVRQRHAIRWWEALSGQVPLRMWLHRGGHGMPSRADATDQMYAWFDRYVKGTRNGVESEAPVEVESRTGAWTSQQNWPHEKTSRQSFFLNPGHVLGREPALAREPAAADVASFTDAGKTRSLEALLASPTTDNAARLAFVTAPLPAATILSGTTHVRLTAAVMNRHATNVTVALVDYPASGTPTVVTRGWADPQNHADLAAGEALESGRAYELSFDIEPKQHTFARGSRIGVVVIATDHEHTLRPDAGTKLAITLGAQSSVEMSLGTD